MALPASDAFSSGSDQTLTAYSSNWTNNHAGMYVRSAGNATAYTPLDDLAAAHWNADTFGNDQYSQVTLGGLPDTYQNGICVRANTSGTDNYYYYMVCNNGGWNDRIGKIVSGSNTNLGTTPSDNVVNSDVIRLEASGTTLTPLLNGSTTDTPGAQTDSTFSSGAAGIMGNCSADIANCITMDNWEGGDLGGTTHNATGTVSGTSSLTGVGKRSFSFTGTVSGTSSLTGVGKRSFSFTGAVSGTSSLTAIGKRSFSFTGTVGGTSSLTAIGQITGLEQEGFRWRDDDGSEITASWLNTQDVTITRAAGLTTRLRVLVNATGDPSSNQYQLETRVSGSGDAWEVIQ